MSIDSSTPDSLVAVEARVTELDKSLHDSLIQMQKEFEARMASHYTRLESLVLNNRTGLGAPLQRGGRHYGNSSHDVNDIGSRGGSGFTPKPKLDPPKCDGLERLSWLYKVREYFEFYDTLPDERLRCVALMFDGSAADWFRWRMNNGLISDWDDFVHKFKLRFDPLHYVDYFGQLAKLRQTGSVMDYQAAFEKTLQHVTGASEENLISLFHSGLKHHIQHEIGLLKPSSLSDLFALARELEAKHNALVHSVSQR